MAKVQQKSEKVTPFGGIFFVLDKFDRILSSVIDSHLGQIAEMGQKVVQRGTKNSSKFGVGKNIEHDFLR